MKQPAKDWYRKIWTMDIKDMSWVEETKAQVDFIQDILELQGNERILDLACGYGRHSLELARRGYEVVGYDITAEYVEDGNMNAKLGGLNASFYQKDIRAVDEVATFDIVLNLADGAIGYLENDEENLKIFDVITRALKPGGKSLIDICNQDYALKYFPKRHWEVGENAISLPWFDYDKGTKRMLYGGFTIRLGEPAQAPQESVAHSTTRLYNRQEIMHIFNNRGMSFMSSCGAYDKRVADSEDQLQLLVISKKNL